jgi:hypothetical protein
VEHRKLGFFVKKWCRFVKMPLVLAILITQTACKKPIENPETLDPIYADILSEVTASKAAAAEEEDAIKDLKAKLAALPPRDAIRGRITRELYAHEHNLVQAQQRVKYYEVRSEERKEYDTRAYMIAFEADKPWPNPADLEEYKKIKKLQSASRNWEDRVPKNNRYNPQAPAPKKAKPAQGGHH